VENTFVLSATKENPVMKDAAAGLTPMLPVITVAFTVLIAVFARMAKLAAVPRFTASGPAGAAVTVAKLHVYAVASAVPRAFWTPVERVAV
jgi:hypothetical protein